MPRPSLSKSWKKLTSKPGARKHASIYKRRLDWTKQEIRLIMILPQATSPSSVGPSRVEIELHYVSLQDAPKYTALSYAWGDPDVTQSVLVDGKMHEVTINLEAALREIRSEQNSNKKTSPTMYWIDALCIDQSDDMEKAEQVQNMSTIYRQSTEAVIWLGEGDPGISLIFPKLKELASLAQAAGIKDYLTLLDDEHDDAFLNAGLPIFNASPLFHHDLWPAVFDFFSRDWWQRAWVVQEITFAPSARIACGPERIDWSDIISFLTLVTAFVTWQHSLMTTEWDYMEKVRKGVSIHGRAGYFLQMRHVINQSLGSIIMLPYFCGYDQLIATDPKDQIYSRLAFMQESDRTQITVRYDSLWSCRQLYAQVTEIVLREVGFSIFHCAEHGSHSTELELPSWVLNFNKPRGFIFSIRTHNSFHACGVMALKDFNFHVDTSRDLLHLQGLEFDSIMAIGQPFIHPSFDIIGLHELDTQDRAIRHMEELIAWIKDLRRMLSTTSGFYMTSDSELTNFDLTEDAIWTTCVLACDKEKPSTEIHESYKTLMGEIEPPEEFKDDSCNWKLEGSSLFIDRKTIRGRTPFVTSKGYLGLANEPVCSEDHVYLLQGAKTPFVFHKKENGQLELKSDAYVHGIMFGEVFDDEVSPKEWTPLEVC
jgi:hypothetical protein